MKTIIRYSKQHSKTTVERDGKISASFPTPGGVPYNLIDAIMESVVQSGEVIDDIEIIINHTIAPSKN
jgi:hypothetical protein